MFGPSFSGTARTPDLMVEAGLIYHADWLHDDQPVPIKVRSGKLVSVPYTIELNDGPLFRHQYEGDDFMRDCKAQFDQLYKEGGESGRVMCIGLHPNLSGQPHRIKYLDETLRYIMSHEGVWQTTADEIAEYYIANYYDQAVAHAEQLNRVRSASLSRRAQGSPASTFVGAQARRLSLGEEVPFPCPWPQIE